jgi:hypothetical protein
VRLGYGQLKRLSRPEIPCPASLGKPDEILIADARAGLTAADMVERKLVHLLKNLHPRQRFSYRPNAASGRNMLCE